MRAGIFYAMVAVVALPAYAEVSDSGLERAMACFDAREWSCAFDGLVNVYQTPETIGNCLADNRHGCSYEMISLTVSGIGAAEQSGAPERGMIAERALGVMQAMSEGLIETEGEIAFSALRYDACKAASNQACMAESADLMRLAYASGYGSDDAKDFVDGLLGEYGIRYPLDLALVMKEVAGMEKQE